MTGRPPWASLRGLGARPLIAFLLLATGAAWYRARPELAQWIWMAALVAIGLPTAARTFAGLLRGHFAADVVAALAIVAAIALWQPFAGLIVVLMQTGGEALERRAEGRASAALEALVAAAPRIAHRLAAQGWVDADLAEVRPGDVLLVRPGELVPCDGEVRQGDGALDLSRLTGEPIPVPLRRGLKVRSGSGVLDAPLELMVERPAAASEYERIVAMVRAAQASKAPFQRVADRFAIWFTPLVVVAAMAAWIIARHPDRALAVLVVATPCPMILAAPVAMIGGIGRAARRGLIFRRGGGIEAAAGVTAAIVDKTGTLTLGRPEVVGITPLAPYQEDEVLALAAAVEHGSGHELARSIEAEARRRRVAVPEASAIREAAGRGVTGRVGSKTVVVGGLEFVTAEAPAAARVLRHPTVDSSLRAYVAVDGVAAGVVDFADRPRPEAAAAVERLRQLGIKPILLLSGDAREVTEALGRALDLDAARGEQLPADKLAAVTALKGTGARVLMVGDGVNDAPALSAADLGVALAAGGGGISAEAADVVVLNDDLNGVPEAIRIGRRTMRIARQSLWIGLGLSGVAMAFAAVGAIPPALGALLQEAIDVAVILNAVRASGGGDLT